MDADRFRELVYSPNKTQKQVEQMYRNALNKGEIKLGHIAEQALNERFPGWNRNKGRKSGATPTEVNFKGRKEWFPTAKDAYVWLIGNFIQDKPDVLDSEDWKIEFVAKGWAVNYFARDRKTLFHHTPHFADDPNNYVRLGHGWFADLNLSNRQKFDILTRFAAVAGYRFREDWDWRVDDGREAGSDDFLKRF